MQGNFTVPTEFLESLILCKLQIAFPTRQIKFRKLLLKKPKSFIWLSCSWVFEFCPLYLILYNFFLKTPLHGTLLSLDFFLISKILQNIHIRIY